jgi:hypothetical protein
VLKILYDLALLAAFRHIKPPEERGGRAEPVCRQAASAGELTPIRGGYRQAGTADRMSASRHPVP